MEWTSRLHDFFFRKRGIHRPLKGHTHPACFEVYKNVTVLTKNSTLDGDDFFFCFQMMV